MSRIASPRFARTLLIIIVAWEVAVLLLEASRTPFWADEILTFHLSGLEPFSHLWSALKAGADGMPVGYYAIVRLARMLIGNSQIAIRLPSILGYVLTLLGIYWFAQDRLPPLARVMAILLVSMSEFRAYAIEARSYALLVGSLAIAAVLWQRIEARRFIAPLLCAFLMLAVAMHNLAVVTLGIFGCAEIAWTLESRRIRWSVWGAMVVATAPFFLNLEALRSLRQLYGKTFWSLPRWTTVVLTYRHYLGVDHKLVLAIVVVFVLVAATLLMRRGTEQTGESAFSMPEMVLIASFLLYPAVLAAIAKVGGGGYAPRYGWPVIFGLTLAILYLLSPRWACSPCLLAGLLAGFAFQYIALLPAPKPDQRWSALASLTRPEAGLPVVLANPQDFLEGFEYAPAELRGRFVYVSDPESAVRLTGTDSPDKTNIVLARYLPLRVEQVVRFEGANRRFYVRSGGIFDWLTPYLVEKGYRLRLLAPGSASAVYLAER